MQIDTAVVGVELLFVTEAATIFTGERVHEPESRVVQGPLVLLPGIPEAGDDADGFRHGVAILNEMQNKKTAGRRSFAWLAE
jgi:hypothetical protein